MTKTFDDAFGDAFGDDFKKAEYSAVPVALGISLIGFGALVAALLPVALAITAIMTIMTTMGLMGLASHLQPMSETANPVMLLVGLAVGVCRPTTGSTRRSRAAPSRPRWSSGRTTATRPR